MLFSWPTCEGRYHMTDSEKNTIRKLRDQGHGYKKIAAELGLSLNTVKSFCRRTTIIESNESRTACEQCGITVEQSPGRKHKRFCSEKCRKAWWSAHQSLINRKGTTTYVCKYCGAAFTSHKKDRVYCSRECYAKGRTRMVIENG